MKEQDLRFQKEEKPCNVKTKTFKLTLSLDTIKWNKNKLPEIGKTYRIASDVKGFLDRIPKLIRNAKTDKNLKELLKTHFVYTLAERLNIEALPPNPNLIIKNITNE